MGRSLAKLVALLILVFTASAATWYYLEQSGTARKLAAAEKENQVLSEMIQRLSRSQRIAELIVTDKRTANGVTQTTVVFAEAREGQPLPARTFTLEGDMIHIAAQVIQFDRDYIKHNDPLRGHSIALFTKIYGSNTAPRDGFSLDDPGRAPAVYQGNAAATEFESKLWQDFWKMAGDTDYANTKGVRVANGQEVFGPFETGKHYTITLESAGGMSLIAKPMPTVYKDALTK
jgi:hypothetical protein